MSASTVARPAARTTGQRPVQPVTPLRVARSEWIKLRSLRPAWITMGIAVTLMAGLGVLFAAITAGQWSGMSAASRASFDAVSTVLSGYQFAQLAVGVLGVLVVSSEYSSGMIRATFAAVPRRLPVLWAKAAVFGVVTWVVMTIAALAAFAFGMAVLSTHGLQVPLFSAGVLRAVAGAGLYLAVIGLLGVSLGALLRSAAGAIAALAGLLLLVPILVNLLPSAVKDHIGAFLPSNAAQALVHVHHQAGSLPLWAAVAVLCGWAGAALAAAAVTLRRRDA
jgi:ABC-type transport system involved in multi-copper enzyme maturation permease subunit